MGFYPVSTLVHDAKRHGVEVRPPCLATGSWDCTTEAGSLTWEAGAGSGRREAGPQADPSGASHPQDDNRLALRIGWRFVRSIGDKVIDALKAAYAERPFSSIADVVERGKLNRAEVLAFAQAGAFAHWAADRRHAAWEGLRATGDILPLAPATVSYHDPVPINRDQLVFLDYHAVGMSIYGHPMSSVREKLKSGGAIDSRELEQMPDKRLVTLGGLATVRQRPSTAGGTIFLLLEEEWGFVNVVVPQKLVEPYEEVVKRAPFVLVQGRVENDGAAISIVGQRFKELEVGALTHRAHEFR